MPAFLCLRCGNCCRPRGHVRLTEPEQEAIAAFLGVSLDAFLERYTRLADDRRGLSLVEQPGGACIFLTPQNDCQIQPVKPTQCRGFPEVWGDPSMEPSCAGLIQIGGRAALKP